ncbi:hypothetical protein N7E81_17430 [Reichenbachiella carrageenanivorans]|uniref:Heparinase II/III-like protein n=1 Tax=Reichenbachiella carrageenanivorans TaxID=2979869 RepID=A0ABY6D249_9BACT|nr:hypothetical protein [Reichenbachiella carrageenanivorans]UXX79138.1 hypothetical protein N7E81_17430 [Reichenbachiella carrageenanivorans]
MKRTFSNLKIIIAVVVFSLTISLQNSIAGNIIDTTDYSYWRKLALTSEMYEAMKTSAITIANQGDGETRDVMGANALAYILDPSNKNKYINAIKNKFESRIRTMKIGTGAATSSVPSHELLHALLALDVIRYELDEADLSSYEHDIKDKIFQLVTHRWKPHGIAMRMMWYKYANDTANFAAAKKQYDIDLAIHFFPDGYSPSGNGYVIGRFNHIGRGAKNSVFDLMEYMGYNEYFSNLGFRNMHEFMYGYAAAPFGANMFYGDTRGGGIDWTINGTQISTPTIARAARFSDNAYKWAMWRLKEQAGLSQETATLQGYLLSYVMMAGSAANNHPIEIDLDDAELAPSRIFDNYAALIGNNQSKDALYLSVLSMTEKVDWHAQYEANSIGLSGYGERILRNSGYDGPNNDVSAEGLTSSWDFIKYNSESGNVLMIDGEKHTSKFGQGIEEGITDTNIEYFRASSQTAIKGEHFRDVMFVQAANGANGYYIVMDHVKTDVSGATVNIVWHPNTAIIETVEDQKHYHSALKVKEGALGPVLYSNNTVELATFLGTPPISVEKKEMVNQRRQHHYRAGYLYNNYSTSNNKADILTVLFPGDQNHKIGSMARITTEVYTGGKITQGNVVDIALTSDSSVSGTNETESFQAANIVYRKLAGKLVTYFVKGTSFKSGQDIPIGFSSETPITIYMNGKSEEKKIVGKIISSGAKVTFYDSDISAVKIDDKKIPVDISEPNSVSVTIPIGTYKIELEKR